MSAIRDVETLRSLYAMPSERALNKEITELDVHCKQYISLSPFCLLTTVKPDGTPDLSPKGGRPGFVRVLDEHTMLMPDSLGNNRLDSISNATANPNVAFLFLIPGVDETLRVYGTTEIVPGDEFAGDFMDERRPPKTVLRVNVTKAYLHCAKALMRSELWSEKAKIERSLLPTMGQMMKDHTCDTGPVETQEAMLARYAELL
jgi:PPOX class probable FMN-dependent enzyme